MFQQLEEKPYIIYLKIISQNIFYIFRQTYWYLYRILFVFFNKVFNMYNMRSTIFCGNWLQPWKIQAVGTFQHCTIGKVN
jgi:hypothetical protein